jgi:hypothetical protein
MRYFSLYIYLLGKSPERYKFLDFLRVHRALRDSIAVSGFIASPSGRGRRDATGEGRS